MTEPALLLVRANDVCFLGSARSAAAAGAEVEAITYTWPGAGPWYSEQSRVVPPPTVIPNPHGAALEARDAFRARAREIHEARGSRPLVVPSSDTNMMFVLDHEAELRAHLRYMGSSDLDAGRMDVVRKDSCAELLARGGVPLPVTFACTTEGDVDEIVERIPYPCIFKPLVKDYGQTFYAKHGGEKAVDAASPDALRAALLKELHEGFQLLVQERVVFDSPREEIPCYVYVDESHRVRMAATAFKHTIDPYPYGTATVLHLTWHPELLEIAQSVATALEWRGILMIELIRDQKDGVFKVIEINGRPWLFVDFFRRFGLNYLGYLYDDLRGQTAHWPELRVLDDAALASTPVHISLPRAVAPHLASLGRKPEPEDVAAFLASLPGRRTLTFLDPDDPGPGEAEIRDLAERHGMNWARLLSAVQNVLSGD